MMTIDEVRRIHREETLRWNRQFSLISRIEPEKEVDLLLEECVRAFAEAETAIKAFLESHRVSQIHYYDIGSGGGFPGIEWAHLMRCTDFPANPELFLNLVEPRSKRAWFLDGCLRATHQKDVQVHESRWQDLPPIAAPPEETLIVASLKAIDLDNAELSSSRPGYQIMACRFESRQSAGNILDISQI